MIPSCNGGFESAQVNSGKEAVAKALIHKIIPFGD